MQRIRLFVDAHVFDGIPQGTVTYLAALYSELIKDERFKLYIGSDDKATAEQLLGSSNFIHIKYNTHSKFKRLLFSIPKALRENEIDYAHFQYISPIFKPFNTQKSFKNGRCRYIVTVHDLLFLEFPQYFPLSYRIKNFILFYLSSKRADLLTTVSEYSRESIHRYFKIPLSKIEITPNSVIIKTESPEPIMELENKKFIFYVSRTEPRKNQALMLQVWKELNLCGINMKMEGQIVKQNGENLTGQNLAGQNIDLVLVGPEAIRDEKFQQQIQSLSEQEREHFHWIKKTTPGNLKWLYQNCILFVFPSAAEGFGIPPLEAAVYGAKVLCSNATAMSDYDFFKEFLFDPNNLEEFKQKLLWALTADFPHQAVIEAIQYKYNRETIAKNFADKLNCQLNKVI